MTEILYVLRSAKRGEYGQLYGVLNIVAILDWFKKYSEQRTQKFINSSTKDIQTDFSLRSEDRKILKRHNKLNSNRD